MTECCSCSRNFNTSSYFNIVNIISEHLCEALRAYDSVVESIQEMVMSRNPNHIMIDTYIKHRQRLSNKKKQLLTILMDSINNNQIHDNQQLNIHSFEHQNVSCFIIPYCTACLQPFSHTDTNIDYQISILSDYIFDINMALQKIEEYINDSRTLCGNNKYNIICQTRFQEKKHKILKTMFKLLDENNM